MLRKREYLQGKMHDRQIPRCHSVVSRRIPWSWHAKWSEWGTLAFWPLRLANLASSINSRTHVQSRPSATTTRRQMRTPGNLTTVTLADRSYHDVHSSIGNLGKDSDSLAANLVGFSYRVANLDAWQSCLLGLQRARRARVAMGAVPPSCGKAALRPFPFSRGKLRCTCMLNLRSKSLAGAWPARLGVPWRILWPPKSDCCNDFMNHVFTPSRVGGEREENFWRWWKGKHRGRIVLLDCGFICFAPHTRTCHLFYTCLPQ